MNNDKLLKYKNLAPFSPKKALIPTRYFNNQPSSEEYFTVKENKPGSFRKRSPSISMLKKDVKFQGANLAPISSPKILKDPTNFTNITPLKFQRGNMMNTKDTREELKMNATNGFLTKKNCEIPT
ncbi:unnamed protein product [Moneuplotes crassus]|uniref:Uncharacterized protein n=1 Tax=Euplotes crassus TaxID=5936 RepID=A0AAD1YAS8_EUPCR|nr:unnamed protein product [Moneuplotes crassus]